MLHYGKTADHTIENSNSLHKWIYKTLVFSRSIDLRYNTLHSKCGTFTNVNEIFRNVNFEFCK